MNGVIVISKECPKCGWDFIEECTCGHKEYLDETADTDHSIGHG